MDQLTSLLAISPTDGRYFNKTHILSSYFSEAALFQMRVTLELRYLQTLSEKGIIRSLTKKEKKVLQTFEHLDTGQIERIKELESITRHDVKAMEKGLRELLSNSSLEDLLEWLHFGLTSEDINNLAFRLLIQEAIQNVYVEKIQIIITKLTQDAKQYKSLPMLARTHGQSAVPTTYGKELVNIAHRLQKELLKLTSYKLTGKLNGAVGNFNSLTFVMPDIDWTEFSETFLQGLGLIPNLATTQINPCEDIIELLQIVIRIEGILLDLDQDMWRYISDGWLQQEVKKDEVGSSTMPQKVNPIDFENSEGNCKLGVSFLEGISHALATSRLQRDLSGSTVMRNIGLGLSYFLLALESTATGLQRIRPNEEKMKDALYENWSILTEAAQTLLRQKGVDDAYSLVKKLSRGHTISQHEWQDWVKKLPVDLTTKNKLSSLTPSSYIGKAVELTEKVLKFIE